jgi:hypothetical protein
MEHNMNQQPADGSVSRDEHFARIIAWAGGSQVAKVWYQFKMKSARPSAQNLDERQMGVQESSPDSGAQKPWV